MEKKIVTSKKLTFSFIWHFILYTIIMTLIAGFIYTMINDKINNTIIMNIISLIFSSINIFIATKLSLKDIFAEKTLKKEDIKKYRRNIIIFFIICILLNIMYYAIIYVISIMQIDKVSNNLQIAINQDISGITQQAKDIQLAITCIVAVTKGFVYIGMIKYQDKFISKIS